MKLAQAHKALVVLFLVICSSAVADVNTVSAAIPPIPKLRIVTGMEGTESYCIGQKLEFAALISQVDDPHSRPSPVAVRITDDMGTRGMIADKQGFVHWTYAGNAEGKHTVRLEAFALLRLPAEPVTFTFELKQCEWKLTLDYFEVANEDLAEAGEFRVDASVTFTTTFTSDQEGKIRATNNKGDYKLGLSASGPAASIMKLQGQGSGPIYISVEGTIGDELDIKLSALKLNLSGTQVSWGEINTRAGKIPAYLTTADNVDLIKGTGIDKLDPLPLKGGTVSKSFHTGLFWPGRSVTTANILITVSRVN